MSKSKQWKDPHAAREAEKYDNPIPSRELILKLLSESDQPLDQESIAARLGIDDEEHHEALFRRLRAMGRDGQLTKKSEGRWRPYRDDDAVEGIVRGHRDGYGFLLVDDDEDVFLAAGQMRGVFDGDHVAVQVTKVDRSGSREGRIDRVLMRNTQQLVGRLAEEGGRFLLSADNDRIHHTIEIVDKADAAVGDYVMVAITRQPDWQNQPQAKVVDVLGDIHTPGVATEVAIRTHGIPHEWPIEVEEQARRFASEPSEDDKKARRDLRDLPLVTIDGEDARDFDDAVCCKPTKDGGWTLWVAIADVSHYVSVDSALDKEAHLRSTSVYFPDRVVPMLPETLSNGLCSLKPKVDRLCMVCEMSITKAGKLADYVFYEAVMHSHARLTYNAVAKVLDLQPYSPDTDDSAAQPMRAQLEDLHDLYKTLRKARTKRGAIDFETVETRVVYDDEKRIDRIQAITRNDAHRIIEECMLCANVAAASLLDQADIGALYRVHQGPRDKKLQNLREYLGELGLSLSGGNKPDPSDYAHLLNEVKDRSDADLIQTMMLRSLSQAVYQPDNQGHFGLNYEAYAHFRSPIRRYPDLLVHRAIRYLVRNNKGEHVQRERGAEKLTRKAIYPYDTASLLALGEHCSTNERRADDASRDVMAWLKCEFLSQHVGDEFDGTVTAVTGFGLFVELKGLYIEGLIHISALGKDYYQFEPARQRLIAERSRNSYQLGDELRVTVARVDSEDRKVDLALVETLQKPRKGGASPVSRIAANRAKKEGKGGGRGAGKGPKSKKGKSRGANKSKGTNSGSAGRGKSKKK